MKFPILIMLFLITALFSCELNEDDPLVTISYKEVQYSEISGLVFPILFPAAADITANPGWEIASHGPTLGATIAIIELTSTQTFYITGVRIKNVRYRLNPADGNPIGTSSDIEYSHPVWGILSPIIPNLSTSNEEKQAVIQMQPDTPNHFEVGFSSAISYWKHIDSDRDGLTFDADDNEEINLSCSLFFEGYLEDGTEFSGSFPNPLRVDLIVKHDVP